MKSRVLTLEDLEDNEACQRFQKKFKRIFGKQVVLTKKIARKFGHKFPTAGWAADYLLDKDKNSHRFWKKWEKVNAKHENKLCGADTKRVVKLIRKKDRKLMVIFAKLYISEG